MSEGGESDALAILDGLEEAIGQLQPDAARLPTVSPAVPVADLGASPAPAHEPAPLPSPARVEEPPAALVAKPLALRRYPDPAPRPAGVRPTVASCAAVLERFHWGEPR